MLSPYPYQQHAIDIGRKKNVLIADACGLGKTLMGIEIGRTIQEEWMRPNLVVCTKSARLQWSYAISDQISNAYIKALDATLDFDLDWVEDFGSRGWLLIHFAALRKLTPRDPMARQLWSCVLVDEAHRMKGRNTQQTRGIKRLQAIRKIPMTATEMERSPADLWSLLNWMYPERFRGYWGFHAKFVATETNWMGYKKDVGIRPEAKEKLGKMLAPLMVKRTKEEVRPDLPPLTETRIPVEMNSVLQGAYRDIKTAGDIIVDTVDQSGKSVDMVIPNVLSRIMKEREILSNGLDGWRSEKIQWVKEYFADNAANTNIAVFTVFRKTAVDIAHALDIPIHIGGDHYDIAGLRPAHIVGTIRSLGESHDMPWIDTSIFIDVDWSSIAMAQAKDRIHRINITSPKLAIYLYHPGTVDELVFEALDNKWNDIQVVREYISRYSLPDGKW